MPNKYQWACNPYFPSCCVATVCIFRSRRSATMRLCPNEAVAALSGPALAGNDRELLAFGVGVGGRLSAAVRSNGGPRRWDTGASDGSGSPDVGPVDGYREDAACTLLKPSVFSLYESKRVGPRQQQQKQQR